MLEEKKILEKLRIAYSKVDFDANYFRPLEIAVVAARIILAKNPHYAVLHNDLIVYEAIVGSE